MGVRMLCPKNVDVQNNKGRRVEIGETRRMYWVLEESCDEIGVIMVHCLISRDLD